MSTRDEFATEYMTDVYGEKTIHQFLYWNDGLEIFNAGWDARDEEVKELREALESCRKLAHYYGFAHATEFIDLAELWL